MSSFTIHALEPELDARLAERAKLAKVSKNQLIKDVLSRATGLPASSGLPDDYREFCGLWTQEERAAFDAAQADNERVDSRDWAN